MKSTADPSCAPAPPLSPPELLLSLGSRFCLGPEDFRSLAGAARAAAPEEWDRVVEEALLRYTGGLLCRHLRAAGVDPPPGLQKAHRKAALAHTMTEAELRRLGPALGESGVSPLLVKGAALKCLVYAEPGLRPADDVDWVLRTDAERAAAARALEALGYEPSGGNFWSRGSFEMEFHRGVLGDERVLARLAGLDAAAEASPDEGVWRRARPSPLGEPYRHPAPEDHLLILCAHLMKHNFEPGIWFTDIEALLAAHPDFDWDAALRRARAWGLLRPLAYTFRMMGALEAEESLPPVSLPPGVGSALRAVRPTALDRALLALSARGALLAGEKEEWARPPVANLLWLSSQKGLAAKLRLLWEAAFPRGEVMRELYPGYRPTLRALFMVRRAADLIRLGGRLVRVLLRRGGR